MNSGEFGGDNIVPFPNPARRTGKGETPRSTTNAEIIEFPGELREERLRRLLLEVDQAPAPKNNRWYIGEVLKQKDKFLGMPLETLEEQFLQEPPDAWKTSGHTTRRALALAIREKKAESERKEVTRENAKGKAEEILKLIETHGEPSVSGEGDPMHNVPSEQIDDLDFLARHLVQSSPGAWEARFGWYVKLARKFLSLYHSR